MGYVFISYSSKNEASARSIRKTLELNKMETWMAPDNIPAGKNYGAVINHAIKECACVLLVLTSDAMSSTWVPKEIERAINYGKTIVTLKLENIPLNDEFEFYLSNVQQYAAFSDWKTVMTKMLIDIRDIIKSYDSCPDFDQIPKEPITYKPVETDPVNLPEADDVKDQSQYGQPDESDKHTYKDPADDHGKNLAPSVFQSVLAVCGAALGIVTVGAYPVMNRYVYFEYFYAWMGMALVGAIISLISMMGVWDRTGKGAKFIKFLTFLGAILCILSFIFNDILLFVGDDFITDLFK